MSDASAAGFTERQRRLEKTLGFRIVRRDTESQVQFLSFTTKEGEPSSEPRVTRVRPGSYEELLMFDLLRSMGWGDNEGDS